MASEPLQRLQDDLATVRAALGTELPYDRSHVVLYFLSAALALPLGGLELLGVETYIRPVLFGCIALLIMAWFLQIRYLRTRRLEAPALWRWGRKETIASLLAITLLVGYVIWVATQARGQGRWGRSEAFALASSILFFLGSCAAVWVTFDHRRWHLLGAAAALLGAGLSLPLCSTLRQFYLVMAIMILTGGLSSGLLLLWQIHRHEVEHAD
jgi:hypothetical protein